MRSVYDLKNLSFLNVHTDTNITYGMGFFDVIKSKLNTNWPNFENSKKLGWAD